MSTIQTLETQKQTTTWTLDPAHSSAEFVVRHLMIANVRGQIPILRATIHRDENDITMSRVEAELDVAALSTGAIDRDNHLRSADFFDVANHPTMKFVSTRVEEVEDGLADQRRLRLHGDLTIRDVTRPVVLDVELMGMALDPWGNTKAAAEATTTFDRRDFGLTWNAALEAGGVLVGDKVKVNIALQVAKQAV